MRNGSRRLSKRRSKLSSRYRIRRCCSFISKIQFSLSSILLSSAAMPRTNAATTKELTLQRRPLSSIVVAWSSKFVDFLTSDRPIEFGEVENSVIWPSSLHFALLPARQQWSTRTVVKRGSHSSPKSLTYKDVSYFIILSNASNLNTLSSYSQLRNYLNKRGTSYNAKGSE